MLGRAPRLRTQGCAAGICSSGKSSACVHQWCWLEPERDNRKGLVALMELCALLSMVRRGPWLSLPCAGSLSGQHQCSWNITPHCVFAGAAGLSLGAKLGLTSILGSSGAAIGAKLSKGKEKPPGDEDEESQNSNEDEESDGSMAGSGKPPETPATCPPS